jgi:AcrR family transcriptional regulator
VRLGGSVADVSRREQDRMAIVEATIELLSRGTLARLTMAEISRASGVPRATLYTHFSSKTEVLEAVLLVELGRFMEAVEAADRPDEPAAERLVAAFCITVRRLRGHVVLRRLLREEPEVILPLIVTNDEVLQLGRAWSEQRLREAADETMRDPADAAEFVTRILYSLLLFGGSHYDLDDERQVAQLAREWVLPVVFRQG